MAKGGSTSTTSQNLPAWLQPYAKNFMDTYSQQAYGDLANRPDLNQNVAGFTPAQLQSQQMIQGLTGPAQGLANLGGMENARTLSGAYLSPDTNPYLQATYDAAARGVTTQFSQGTLPGVTAAAQRAGQFGSSAMGETMQGAANSYQQNLQDLAANIYGGNYQQERARQTQQLGLAPQTLANMYAPAYQLGGVGAQQQGQAQSELDTNYQNRVTQAEYPYNILSGLGGALGQAGSGAGTSTTKTSGGGGLFGK